MSDNPTEAFEQYAAMANKIVEHADIKPQVFAIGKQLHSDWETYAGAVGMVRALADHLMASDVLSKALGIGEGFMAKGGLKRLMQMVPEKLPESFDALPPPKVISVRDLVCIRTTCAVGETIKHGDVGPHHDGDCPRFCSVYEILEH